MIYRLLRQQRRGPAITTLAANRSAWRTSPRESVSIWEASSGRSVPAAAAALLAALLVALSCVAPRVPVPVVNPGGAGGAIGGAPAGFPQPTVSAVVPPDVEIPATVAEVDSQPFFDDLSWRTFI